MAEPLEVIVQATPNPNAAKFTLNRVVAASGATYRLPAAAEPEWATRLLGIPGVTQVFALNNFISITKAPEAAWDALAPQVEAELRRSFA